jgi:hypothetical protein
MKSVDMPDRLSIVFFASTRVRSVSSIARTAPLQEKQTSPRRRKTDGLLTAKQLSRQSDRSIEDISSGRKNHPRKLTSGQS